MKATAKQNTNQGRAFLRELIHLCQKYGVKYLGGTERPYVSMNDGTFYYFEYNAANDNNIISVSEYKHDEIHG